MRRLIFQEYVTLDGYAAGPGGALDFFERVADTDDADRDNLRLLESIDTMLLGATTYRLFVDFWPTADDEVIAPVLNRLHKVVVSSTLESAPWGEWEPGTVVSGDAAEAVSDLKRQDGKDIILWGSITLFHALLAAGLVDEVQLRVCPLVLGEGMSVFPHGVKVDLELLEARPWATGGVLLRYQPHAGTPS
ncbi:MAG TPA: dihydrofolate reductase family protein [Kribbella sp.]|nr:dihydrofolate reductase family protein [Kribbella sp.]